MRKQRTLHLSTHPGNAVPTAVLYFPDGQESDTRGPRKADCSRLAKHTKEIKDLTDSVAHVVKHMATKDDIAGLRRELKGDILTVQMQVNSIEQQLRDTKIEVRLGNLEDKVFGAPRR
jgi:hypothetical protein